MNKNTDAKKEELEGFTFQEDGHKYFFDGKPLTGITTILKVLAKPALIQWAANMAVSHLALVGTPYYGPNNDLIDHYIVNGEQFNEAKVAHRKKKEEAGEIGTDVHSQIEEIIKSSIKYTGGVVHEIIKIALNQVESNEQLKHFVDWAIKNKVKFLVSEVRIYSKEYWLGGTCDFVCEIGKDVWIGDIKTGSGIYPEHFFQTAGYQLLFKEMGLYPKIKGHLILNLKKDFSFEEKRSISNEENRDAFLAALKLYRVMEKINGQVINK